jgi:hypothetical protein
LTITYPLSLPRDEFAQVTVFENNGTSLNASPFTGRESVQVFDAEFWEAEVQSNEFSLADARALLGWRSALRGHRGTFLLPHPSQRTSGGTAATVGGSPTVNGNGQTGSTVLIKSAPLSQTGYLVAGDIIQIGPASRAHWHRILEDVDTDGSGNATLSIWPQLRSGVINGDAVRYATPLCLFRLSSQVQEEEARAPLRTRIRFRCREALS